MADRFRVTLAQLNATVGDLEGNAALARKAWEAGREAGADLVALPSRSENFGFAVAEAMVAGVPVIVSEGVGRAPMVRHWRCGTVIPVGDVTALTDALLAYRDPQRRATEGARAHAAAVAGFSLERMGEECAALYAHVAAAHRRRS